MVVGVPVELDDQALVSPQRIDLDDGVDLGGQQPGFEDEVDEPALELGARGGTRSTMLGDERAQRPQTAPSPRPLAESLDGPHVEQSKAVRLLERRLELARPQNLGKVQERAGDGGHRYRAAYGLVVGVQSSNAVEGDAGLAVASASGNAYVGRRARCLTELPERCRTAVAEHSTGSAGEHGRHPPSFGADRTMSQGVDPAVKGMKSPDLDPVPDRSSPEPELQQLSMRDDAMLAGRESGDRVVTWAL